MPTIRNFLICVGLLLLSGWLAILFFPISHLTDGISHDENVIGAMATGFLDSLPQLFATAIAGVCITLTAIGRKPER
jgi:Ca2+/Na+ antiporter